MRLNRPLLLSSILLLCCSFSQQHSVVIIGAGAAGLAAATRFLAHNVADVTVLEAERRIGGRVHSVPLAETIVDLGAEWIDGQAGNAVYEFVKDLDLLGEPEPGWDVILLSDGRMLSKELSLEISGLFEEARRGFNDTKNANKTVGDLFPAAYVAAVEKKYLNDPETRGIAMACFPLMENMALGLDNTFSWYESSAVRTYRTIPGVQLQTWKEGKCFTDLFDVMAKRANKPGIDSLLGSVVHLNKVVSQINYSGDKPIVTCADGSTYKSDFVLFTPSLGVLKHDHKDLFKPGLPKKKVKAIEDLGYGSLMKIAVHYPNAWWPNDTGAGGFNFAITENDGKELAKLFPNDPIKDGKSWICGIFAVFLWKRSNVMLFYVTGPTIPDVEQMSDDRIKAGIEFLVTQSFKHQAVSIPKPDKILKTMWYSNPHFRGTTSFETVQADDLVHSDLAAPVKNEAGKEVVFFAGEATVLAHYGTVHGAVESGHREAYKILNEMGIDRIKMK